MYEYSNHPLMLVMRLFAYEQANLLSTWSKRNGWAQPLLIMFFVPWMSFLKWIVF